MLEEIYYQILYLPPEYFSVFCAVAGLLLYYLGIVLTGISIGSKKRVRVVWVCDGDTIIVRGWIRKYRVRLAGLDAPEGDQKFGKESQEFLKRMIGNKVVTLFIVDKDHWGRFVAFVKYAYTDVNKELVRNGMAWAYKKYYMSLSGNQRYAMDQAEHEAKSRRIGLWSDKNPEAPWTHRKENRDLSTWWHFLWLKIKDILFGKKTYKKNYQTKKRFAR